MCTIYFDSTESLTELCQLGGKFYTDKSPLTEKGNLHRKGYTSIYSLLFASYKHKQFNFCEIGIADSASVQMWRQYFDFAKIYMLEYDRNNIKKCDHLNLKNVSCHHTNVKDINTLNATFKNINEKFDIIIDDSTHTYDDINNIIQVAFDYLNDGGILIIEDIKRRKEIQKFKVDTSKWTHHSFLICHHDKRKCRDDNDKILVLYK